MEILNAASNICVISITVFLVVKIYQLKKYINRYMDIENLMSQVEPLEQAGSVQDNKVKERLIHVVASGKSKHYLGKLYSTDEIEKLDEKELAKLYARYEATLGGDINKTLKNHMTYAYTRVAEFLCPTISQGRFVINRPDHLQQSLNDGPFIDLALTSLTCKLYHEFGHLLAPFETVLLTSNYVRPVDQLQQQQAMQQQAMQQQSMQQQMQEQQASQQYVQQQQAMSF